MRFLILLSGLALLVSCKAPAGIATPKQLKRHTQGLIMEITSPIELTGEILEVTNSDIALLRTDNKEVVRVARERIEMAEINVALTSDNPGRVAAITGLTTLSMAYHGGFWIISVPVNLVVRMAVVSSAYQSAYQIRYPNEVPWVELHKFARFPQGIPATVAVKNLK